jgi:hypothetical protein
LYSFAKKLKFLHTWKRPFVNRFPLAISSELRFTSGEFTTALCRKLGLPIPQLLTAIGTPLSNNANSAKKVGDALGHAYATVTGATGDHVRRHHDTILAHLCDSVGSVGIPYKSGHGKSTKNTFAHCIHENLTSDEDKRRIQGILPDIVLDCSITPGQPSNPLDGCRHLCELKTLSQRGTSVQERAERIQRDIEKHAKDLDARDIRNTVYAEVMSYGIGGRYIALVVGRFGEFSKDFITLRDYIARHKAYAHVENFSSTVERAMPMFKLSITSRWGLMAARGWARLILDRRRDLINDRPNRTDAEEDPLDGAQERYHFDNPRNGTRSAYHHSTEA